MITKFRKWWLRNFKVIPTIKEAIELGLTFSSSVHGDSINRLNCRSIWVDFKGREYRVAELVNHKKYQIKSRLIDGRYIDNAWIEKNSIFFHVRDKDGSVRLYHFHLYEIVGLCNL